MSTELIASGTTVATSSDFTLSSGENATLFLTHAVGPEVSFASSALVQIKDTTSAAYYTAGRLDNNMPVATVYGPGTYRVYRAASATAVGVSKG